MSAEHNNQTAPPFKMGHVVVFGAFTPNQKRCIGLAFNGETGNKEQARAEDVSPKAIQSRWERIADLLLLPWGNRTRQHTMAELCRRHLVEFICILLAILPAMLAATNEQQNTLRTRRVRRSRTEYTVDSGLDIDNLSTTEDITQWLKSLA